jgi:hypothetical protein
LRRRATFLLAHPWSVARLSSITTTTLPAQESPAPKPPGSHGRGLARSSQQTGPRYFLLFFFKQSTELCYLLSEKEKALTWTCPEKREIIHPGLTTTPTRVRLSPTDDSNQALNLKCIICNTVEHGILLQHRQLLKIGARLHRVCKRLSQILCVGPPSSSPTAEELPPPASKAE